MLSILQRQGETYRPVAAMGEVHLDNPSHLGGDGNSTTAWYKLVSGAPAISTGSTPPTLVFSATFGTAAGNFAWAEFGTDNGASDSNTVSGVFLNHGISSQGTKASGQTWTVTETLTFGFATLVNIS